MSRPSSAQSVQSDLSSLTNRKSLVHPRSSGIPNHLKRHWTAFSGAVATSIYELQIGPGMQQKMAIRDRVADYGCCILKEPQEIPELEAEDEPVLQVKVPPKARFPTKKELDMNLQYRLPNHDPEIDLRPLMSALLPMTQVIEEDTLWDPSSLLAEVMHAFTRPSLVEDE